MGDLLQRVFDGVGKGVHRVDAPFVAGVVVRGAADAVNGWVAHIDVGRGHVDLGTQHSGTVGQLAVAHLAKAGQVLRGRAAAKRAVDPGLAKVAPVVAHLISRLFVHIGATGFDQMLGGAVHEVEIVAGLVGRVVAGLAPAEAQPLHRVDDGVDVFGVFFFGVGVVKAQVAHAAVLLGQSEVDANAFGVAHMQIAIGLGRKAGADLGGVWLALGVVRRVPRAARPKAAGVSAFVQIVFDDLAQKVADFVFFGCGRGGGFGHAGILGGCRAWLTPTHHGMYHETYQRAIGKKCHPPPKFSPQVAAKRCAYPWNSDSMCPKCSSVMTLPRGTWCSRANPAAGKVCSKPWL